MPTYTECLSSLFQQQHKTYQWKCSEIIIPIAKTITDSTPRLVNIADTIGFNVRIPTPHERNDLTCYWMSPDYDTNTKDIRKEKLYPLLVQVCHVAGFKVVCQYSSQRLAILVGCNRRLYHPEN